MISTRVRLAARNTLRRRARTLFTLGMVTLSVALLMVALTWIGGIFGAMLSAATAMSGHVRLVDPAFAAREELMPLYENLPQVQPLVERVRTVPGVTAVEPRILTGVTVTVGEQIGDHFAMVVGASERYFREQLEADQKVVAGTWFSGAPDEVVMGRKVAREVGARIGDELVLVGSTQDGSLSSMRATVVGIVHGGSGLLDQQVFAPLEKVQWLVDIPDGAVEVLVYTADFNDAHLLAQRLRALPELSGLAVQAWSEREPWKTTLASVKGVQAVVVFIFVFLTALGIWNTMMMSVLERTHEIGVLRAMGLSRLGAVGLFVGEALAVALAGGLLGVALGLWPSWLLEVHGIRLGEQTTGNLAIPVPEVMRGKLTAEIVFTSFGLGLLMALLGSLPPAFRAASIQPVTAMRTGR
jgi:putative ABC transport system permease protein